MEIPFNKIYLTGNEEKYVSLAILNIDAQKYTHGCAEWIKNHMNAYKVFMTSSGTSALEVALNALEIDKGDEIILPSFTFPSTANAVLLAGGTPVFCEINSSTLCMDYDDFDSKMTSKTKAVIPVHYGGNAYALDKILQLARTKNLYVVEDSAHAFGASYLNKPLGTWGDMGIFSFHSTKNITCGEGGALLLNTKNESINNQVDSLYHNGTNRTEFLQGKTPYYNWQNLGLNPHPSELSMAFLYSQLIASKALTLSRQSAYKKYQAYFLDAQKRHSCIESYSQESRKASSNYHIFYVVFESNNIRDFMMNQMKERGISAAFHFMPLHSSEMGQSLGYKHTDLPITEKISKCVLRLPLYNYMREEETEYIIEIVDQLLRDL